MRKRSQARNYCLAKGFQFGVAHGGSGRAAYEFFVTSSFAAAC
jgi:hypothetical protein